MCGRKVSIDSSWKLEISSTTQVSGEDCSTKVMAGVPMFPPTSVLRPPEAMISPVSVVVVVLPLEPVMATIFPCRKRAVSSISPMTGMPRRRACCSAATSPGTPGLTTIRS